MERFIVKETVGQEYYYSVSAQDENEAVDKVKKGEVVKSISTQEAKPTYKVRRAEEVQ